MIKTLLNGGLGLSVTVLSYKEHISFLVAALTALYLIAQIVLVIRKIIKNQ